MRQRLEPCKKKLSVVKLQTIKEQSAMPNTNKKGTSITAGQRRARQRQKQVRTTRPGVISDIMGELTKAKEKGTMVSTEQILSALARKHKDRDERGMLVTVRAQLSRLPREKGFDIDKARDG